MNKIFLDLKKGPKHWYNEAVQAKMSPAEIALGFSIGIFFTLIALPVVNLLLALVAMALLRVNKLAVMLGYILIPWPFAPFTYYTSLRIGFFIFGYNVAVPEIKDISFAMVWDYGVAFAIGNIILATALAILSFLLVYSAANLIQIIKNRRKNILLPNDRAN